MFFFDNNMTNSLGKTERLEKVQKYSNSCTYELVEREKINKVGLLELPTHYLPNRRSAKEKAIHISA